MKIQPKKSKYIKAHKGKAINRIIAKYKKDQFNNSSIVLKSLISYKLTGKQIEILYITLNKFLKKAGSINIKIFPDTPISKKPNEIRMGKGKGAISHWVCRVLAGTVLCEIETNNIKKALKAITYTKFRLPIKVKTIIF